MVVEKKGEYVKGEKRQEKYNQIKENLQKKGEIHSKRTTKKKKHGKNRCSRKRSKKENVTKNWIIHTKKRKKDRENGRTWKNIQI